LASGVGSQTWSTPVLSATPWRVARTAHFDVYAQNSDAVLQALASKLETFDMGLRILHGLDPASPPALKLAIYAVKDEAEVQRIGPWIPPRVSGFYHAGKHDIFAAAIAGRDNERVLFHEYAHHFMAQELSSAYPPWLVEGYADYFMSAQITPTQVTFGLPDHDRTSGMLQPGRWIPLLDVLAKRPIDFEGPRVQQYYAQAWAVTHYFLSDAGTATPVRYRQLQDYVRRLDAGENERTAFEAATKSGLIAFEAMLQRYILRDLQAIGLPLSMASKRPATIDAVVSGELLLDHQAIISDYLPADGEALLKSIRRAAGPSSANGFSHRTLAIAELRLGDKALGRELLKRQLEAAPTDQEALEYTAEDLMNQADVIDAPAQRLAYYRNAYALLGRSIKQGVRYQSVAGVARARRILDSRYPSQGALDAWALVLQLAPQVDDFRLQAGEAYVLAGRFDEAISFLAPVRNNPHSPARAQAAKRLTEQARMAKDGKSAPP
jgi:tetratricopeptide (TPR) repeat protein